MCKNTQQAEKDVLCVLFDDLKVVARNVLLPALFTQRIFACLMIDWRWC